MSSKARKKGRRKITRDGRKKERRKRRGGDGVVK